MSKFGNLISQAKGESPEKTIKPREKKTEKQDVAPEIISPPPRSVKNETPTGSELQANLVNLSIKVPEKFRRHWAVEAKRSGTTITAAITEALSNRFGTP